MSRRKGYRVRTGVWLRGAPIASTICSGRPRGRFLFAYLWRLTGDLIMNSTRVLPLVLACTIATISALSTRMADAATSDRSDRADLNSKPHNIDRPRDVFSDGAHTPRVLDQQDRLSLTGKAPTGVSAEPGGKKIRA